jgi:ATP/maltotriose-dependent transcriptional regulator MalT
MERDEGTMTGSGVAATSDLELGRTAFARCAWAAAYEALSRADRTSSIGTEDLERLTHCAYLIGRDDEYLALLQRTYHAYLAAGVTTGAARSAFWLGLRLMFRGETGQSRGWLGRAERLVAEDEAESVERGYLLLAASQVELGDGDLAAAGSSAENALRIGERFGEADLMAIARHLLGHVEIQGGKIPVGISHFDETMVAVAGGELSPIVTGLIYCSVIEGCQDVCALERAREWTRALSEWCDRQPEMLAFTGLCSVHRAEILQLNGAWQEAFAEAQRATERCSNVNRRATGAAYYRQGEIHRLRGEIAAAERAYRHANELGWEPQPGFALLRLAQCRMTDAARSMATALSAAKEPSQRARLLPAYVEILLCDGERDDAEKGVRELAELAARFDSTVLAAEAAQAAGALHLATGDVVAALRVLRGAHGMWERIEAPYAAARVRVLISRCCRKLQDVDGEKLELRAARVIFERLGARLDIARLEDNAAQDPRAPSPALTPRERQILKLVATGRTNKVIASELSLSEKTVERHVSNICTKLDVTSRTAATAYAYEHRLL